MRLHWNPPYAASFLFYERRNCSFTLSCQLPPDVRFWPIWIRLLCLSDDHATHSFIRIRKSSSSAKEKVPNIFQPFFLGLAKYFVLSKKGLRLATTNYYDLILLSYLRAGNLLARLSTPRWAPLLLRSLLFIVFYLRYDLELLWLGFFAKWRELANSSIIVLVLLTRERFITLFVFFVFLDGLVKLVLIIF